MSVAKARQEIGPSEFVRWQHKVLLDRQDEIREQIEGRSREDYMLAQLAQLVYYLIKKVDGLFHPSKMPDRDLDSFLLKFSANKPRRPTQGTLPSEMTEQEYKEYRSRRMRAVAERMKYDQAELDKAEAERLRGLK